MLEKESDVAEKACATLIHTEVSNICNQSQIDSYKEMGVEKYKNLETFDGITCKVCGGHDGEVHDIDEFQVGLTAPPFHPRCRGTTIPVTDNLLSKNRQRAARDPETGKTVYVNEMTYEEWKENFVNEKGQQAWDYYSKSSKNLKIDKKQFDRYKDVLGKYAPDTLEEFQKIKYTNSEEWESLKTALKDKELQDKIRESYNLNIHEGSQGKHILGHNNYIEGRSYLTVSINKAQDIINKYAGTGQILRDRNNKWTNKELIDVGENVGIALNLNGDRKPTSKIIIHYGKNGIHIVPTDRKLKGSKES